MKKLVFLLGVCALFALPESADAHPRWRHYGYGYSYYRPYYLPYAYDRPYGVPDYGYRYGYRPYTPFSDYGPWFGGYYAPRYYPRHYGSYGYRGYGGGVSIYGRWGGIHVGW